VSAVEQVTGTVFNIQRYSIDDGPGIRTTVFLIDLNDFAAVNDAYAAFFAAPYPARSTVQVARLPRDARVEIDVIASL